MRISANKLLRVAIYNMRLVSEIQSCRLQEGFLLSLGVDSGGSRHLFRSISKTLC